MTNKAALAANLAHLASLNREVSRAELSGPDLEGYSLLSGITSARAGTFHRTPSLERDVSDYLQRTSGAPRSASAFHVPNEVLLSASRASLGVSSGANGAYLIGINKLGLIEPLRNRMVLTKLGAKTSSGFRSNVVIPRQTTSATFTWLPNDNTSASEANPAFGQISASPKNGVAYTEISEQLLKQGSGADAIVATDLLDIIAIGIDAAGIGGSGALGQPQGIIGSPSVGSVAGTALDYTHALDFEAQVLNANALINPETCGYVTTPTLAKLLAGRMKAASTWSPMWEGNLADGTMNGFRAMSSLQVPSGNLLFGDFGSVWILEWGDATEIEVNPYANFPGAIFGVRAFAPIDVVVRQGASFCLATGVT